MIEKGEDIPFDIAATRIISIDRTDLDSVEHAKEELKRQIRSVEEDNSKVDNPISVAIELQGLKYSGDPEERLFGAILTKLEEVASKVSKIEKYTETRQQHDLAKSYSAMVFGASSEDPPIEYLTHLRKYLEKSKSSRGILEDDDPTI